MTTGDCLRLYLNPTRIHSSSGEEARSGLKYMIHGGTPPDMWCYEDQRPPKTDIHVIKYMLI